MKMTTLFLVIALFVGVLFAGPSKAEATYVNGYYRSNGTYVNSYYRSRSNAYTYDNYTYKAPTRSNNYGYNTSYTYPTRNYNSNWYTPSTYDSDYSYGKTYNSWNY